MGSEMTRQEFAEYMSDFEKRLDARFGQIDMRFGQIDTQFGQIDTQFDNLARSMKIQFEDVRREIRFSLEAVVGLREVTQRELGVVRAEHRDQTSLIHDVLRHVTAGSAQ